MSIDFGNDIYEEPIVAKTFLQEDAQESSLRPKTLAEYIGQEKAKDNLAIFIQAARKREEALDHVFSSLQCVLLSMALLYPKCLKCEIEHFFEN